MTRIIDRIFDHLDLHAGIHLCWAILAAVVWWNPLTWWLPPGNIGPRSHGTTSGATCPIKPKPASNGNDGGSGIEPG